MAWFTDLAGARLRYTIHTRSRERTKQVITEALTCVRRTSLGSTDVSSCSSRAAALSSGSFSSTKPPGSAHCPCNARWRSQTTAVDSAPGMAFVRHGVAHMDELAWMRQ